MIFIASWTTIMNPTRAQAILLVFLLLALRQHRQIPASLQPHLCEQSCTDTCHQWTDIHLCLLRIYLAFSSVYKWTRNYPLMFSVHLFYCILFGLFLCLYIYINISDQIFHTHPLFFSCNFAFIFYSSFLWLTSFSLHYRFWKQWEICQERM